MTNLSNGSPGELARIQANLLAASERRLLTWLCAKMPNWVTPDLLTGTGVLGAAAMLVGYAASHHDGDWLWLAIVGCLLNWFGDSMDGSLARYRRVERPGFGYFIDHSCDGFATLLILVGIGLSPFVRQDVALVCLAAYLLLSIHAFLSARVLGELKISHVGAGPTELRLVLIAVTLVMMFKGATPAVWGHLSGYDLFFGSAGIVLLLLFVIQTLITARRLAAQEVALQAHNPSCEPLL